MNNPNPFIPQGSVLEQNKRRSRMKLAVFCVLAVGVCGLTAMLIQGCKREQNTENMTPVETNLPPVETNLPPVATNTPVMLPPVVPNTQVVMPVQQEAGGNEYVVVKGDTLGKIAKARRVTLQALKAANPNVEPTKLKLGQKLVIPAGGATAPSDTSASSAGATVAGSEDIYTVKSGDTLSKIAKTHGTTVKAIVNENNLSTTKIKVGQKLKIPTLGAAAAPAPVPPPPAPATPPSPTPAPAGTPNGQ